MPETWISVLAYDSLSYIRTSRLYSGCIIADEIAGQAGIGAAAVTADGDDVDGLILHLAFAHQRLVGGCDAYGARAGGEQLGVHPWHHPGVV